jgi:putative ABC transport system permease protein
MLKHYLLLSLKVLARRKFFTFISVFGISLTLVVLMVITAIADRAFAPMPPETRQGLTLEAHSVVLFNDDGHGFWCCQGSFAFYDRYARDLPGVSLLSIYSDTSTGTSYVNGQKILSSVKRTDADFWKILTFEFIEGRPYTAQELEGAAYVAVINATTRERMFGRAQALGQTLAVDGERFRVVGVVKDVPVYRDVPFSDIWLPQTATARRPSSTNLMGNFRALALASNAAALDDIQREFSARVSRIDPRNYQEGRDAGADAGTGVRAAAAECRGCELTHVRAAFDTKFEAFARGFSPFSDPRSPDPQAWRVMLLFGMMALLFVLLPTVNLVNINVSRIMERASEIGIRRSFGASSRTLVTQFIVENVILTLAGGLIGLLLSEIALTAVTRSGLIPYADLGVNWRVFVYGLLLAVVFGVISGVYPAWRMSRLHPVDALRGARR